MGKKKLFYEEYDALFIKPKLSEKKNKQTIGSTWLQVNSVSEKSEKSKKRQQPTKKETNKRAILWSLSVLTLAVAFVIYVKSNSNYLSNVYDGDYVDVHPLQEAGIKRTGTIDVGKPLVADFDDKVVNFNNGYKIVIKGDLDIEQQKEELSVLPTNEDYAPITPIASLTFYSGRDYLRSVNMSISGNIIASISSYLEKVNGEELFTKAYPQKSIEDVQTGYVINYEKESTNIYLAIQRYYIFSDGTGICLETFPTSDEKTELTSNDSFKEVKKAYLDDFEFLENNFSLTTVSSENE